VANDTIGIAAQNHADEGTFSWYAGWWLDTLPLTNALDRRLSKVARTAGLDPAGTNFTIDLGKLRTIGIIGIIGHNLSPNAQWRVLLSSDGTNWVFDSGNIVVWPALEQFGVLPWGVFQWGGVIAPAVTEIGYAINSYYAFDEDQLARYVRVYLIDATNPTISSDPPGYLQFGRLYIGPIWRPSVNAIYPWSLSARDDSQIEYSRGGEMYSDNKVPKRIVRFRLAHIPEDEFMTQVVDYLDRQKGVSGDCIVIPKPTLTRHLHRQAIYCHQLALGENEEIFEDQWGRLFVFEELV